MDLLHNSDGDLRLSESFSGLKKVLITGASGFIGSHLLKHFAGKEEYQVTGLVRKTSSLFRLEGKQYSLLHASLNDPQQELEDTLRGCDCVLHTAGLASDWGKYEDFYRTNVEGSVNVLKASINAGVKRFVHFSSTVIYGFNGNLNTSEAEKGRPFHQSYCRSKFVSEKRVMSFKDRIELIVLRPSNVFGPFDTTFTVPLLRGIERGLFLFPKGGKTVTSPCYVKNLVQAAECCLKTERGFGEAYNISDGSDITWKEYLLMAAEELNKLRPFLPVPTAPLYWVSIILEKLYRLFRAPHPPPITPYRIAQVAKDYGFSIEKARNTLNYAPTYSTLAGMRESILWYDNFKKNFKTSA